jgi:hypothetical protein
MPRRIPQQLAKPDQNLFYSGIVDPAFLPNPVHPLGISQESVGAVSRLQVG